MRHERKRARSFEYLVGAGQQRGRHGEAQLLCCLQIDRQREFSRELDWQVTGDGTVQYLVHKIRGTMIAPAQIDPVADQSACDHMLTISVNRWQPHR